MVAARGMAVASGGPQTVHLARFLALSGAHFGGWRHPSAQNVHPFDLDHYTDLAARAEAP